MPGPLPVPGAARRNAPTIPTTALPASGRKGPAPDLPGDVKLGSAGAAWWEWAWHTPQAAAWDAGSLYVVARRARLQDLLESDGEVNAAMAREIRELDDRLGLTPKALAALRWKIVDDSEVQSTERRSKRGLSVVAAG